jgi:hypothetical protein
VVGYRTPPTHSQFKKGQSGNPKGRPRRSVPSSTGASTANAIMLQQAERLVTVRDGNEIRKVTVIEAVGLAQAKSAIEGSPYAQRDFFVRYQQAEQERLRKIAEDCDFWEWYIDMSRRKIAEAAARGEPPPKVLPHPDDVLIDREKGVRIVGPGNEDEEAQLQKSRKTLDILLMQAALDWRKHKDSHVSDPLDRHESALVTMHFWNELLPLRYRLTEPNIVSSLMTYKSMTMRSLEKNLYRSWRSIGIPMRRGQTLRPTRVAKQILELVVDIVGKHIDPAEAVTRAFPEFRQDHRHEPPAEHTPG